jgi:endonuclease YncB( thermonuclease family)
MSPEIRISKPKRLIPKSLFETVLTLLVATVFILSYLQLPSTPKKAYELDYIQLEATGQLLFADENLASDRFEKATVTEIVDGDTIKVSRADATTATIRYIGIDTPEIKHQGNGEDEPYGQLATEVNSWLVNGKTVYLQKRCYRY